MESSVDFTPPASSAHMKEQTCFVKHVKANTQNKKKHAAQRCLCEHEYRETHRVETSERPGVMSGCSLTLLNYAVQNATAEHAELLSVFTARVFSFTGRETLPGEVLMLAHVFEGLKVFSQLSGIVTIILNLSRE